MLETADGDKIPYANASTYIRYLGGVISPWKGLVAERLEEDFRTTLQRVKRLALKPHQKARLISNYLIPQYIYTLVLALTPVTTMKRLDQELRRAVKNIFHLPQWTANGLIYARKADGGLGIPKLDTIVMSCSLKTGLKLMETDDPVMRAVCANEFQSDIRSILRPNCYVAIGRAACEKCSATWNLGTNKAFALRARKTTEHFYGVDGSQDLPFRNRVTIALFV
jgi:hypothetical protein